MADYPVCSRTMDRNHNSDSPHSITLHVSEGGELYWSAHTWYVIPGHTPTSLSSFPDITKTGGEVSPESLALYLVNILLRV